MHLTLARTVALPTPFPVFSTMPTVETLDASELDRMRRLFLERMKDDFGDFRDRSGEYWIQERAYKEEFAARVRSALSPSMFEDTTSVAGARAVVKAALTTLTKPLSTIAAPQNLLGFRYSLFLRDLTAAEARTFAKALGDLLYGEGSYPVRAQRFTQSAWPIFKRRSSSNPYAQARIFPTLFLMACYPTENIAIRTDMFREAAPALIGRHVLRNAPLSAAEYSDVLAFSRGVLRHLEHWGWQPRDMLDVHTFLWVVTRPSYNEDDDE